MLNSWPTATVFLREVYSEIWSEFFTFRVTFCPCRRGVKFSPGFPLAAALSHQNKKRKNHEKTLTPTPGSTVLNVTMSRNKKSTTSEFVLCCGEWKRNRLKEKKCVAIFHLLNILFWWLRAESSHLQRWVNRPSQIAIVHRIDGPHSHSLDFLVEYMGRPVRSINCRVNGPPSDLFRTYIFFFSSKFILMPY